MKVRRPGKGLSMNFLDFTILAFLKWAFYDNLIHRKMLQGGSVHALDRPTAKPNSGADRLP